MREQINDRDERSDGVQTVSESMEPSCGHVEERGADVDAAARAVAHARLGGSAVDWLARTWPDAAFEWPTFWENWVDEFDATEASERRRRAVGSTAVERSVPAVGINGGSENGGGGVLAAERSALKAEKCFWGSALPLSISGVTNLAPNISVSDVRVLDSKHQCKTLSRCPAKRPSRGLAKRRQLDCIRRLLRTLTLLPPAPAAAAFRRRPEPAHTTSS